MRWVDVRDCMPDPEDRVLVAMHVQAVKPVVAVGNSAKIIGSSTNVLGLSG